MSSSVTRTPVSVNSKLGKLMRELDSEEDDEEMIKTTRGKMQVLQGTVDLWSYIMHIVVRIKLRA